MDAAQAVNGLRELADFIEAHPDLPWSDVYPGTFEWRVNVFVGNDAEKFAAFAASGGRWDKSTYASDGEDGIFMVTRTFGGGVSLQVVTNRNAVCERKVVGVETVEVPDPDAPKVTVEREVVEWECRPLLAEVVA